MPQIYDAVFLNGTVGVGKSTVAQTVSDLKVRARDPHALIDLDYIRSCWPAPADDPFNLTVELTNLNSIAENYRRTGIKHFILVGVAETCEVVKRYQRTIASRSLLMCRLTATPETIADRLRDRHRSDHDSLRWHLTRATELTSILDAAELGGVVLDTTGAHPLAIAHSVMSAAGW